MKKYIIPIVLSLVFLSFFLYQKTSPFGFSCQADLLSNNHLILGRGCLSSASPKERRELKNNLIVKGDPLYFSLYSPRKFEKLDVEIIFQPQFIDNISDISLGLLVNKELWQYNLQSIYNLALDKFQDYHSIYEEPLLLLQKEKQFKTIAEWRRAFNESGPSLCQDKKFYQCLAVSNLEPEQKRQIKPYYNLTHLEKETIDLSLALKGRHSFFIYLNEEDSLDLLLEFSSLKEEEKILVEILKEDYNIYNYQNDSLEDLEISLSNLGEGVYQVNILISDDIFIDRLKTQARALVFKNRFWPNIEESLDLISDEKDLYLKLLSPENRQEIFFAGEGYKIDELFIQHSLEAREAKIYSINLNKASLLLENKGYFSLKENLLFNPGLGRLESSQEPDFVLTNYILPEKLSDNFLKASASFDLSNSFYEDNLYNFIISVPGLRAEDDLNNHLIVKDIKFKFYDELSFFNKIRKRLNINLTTF